jgi:hypothetical protein
MENDRLDDIIKAVVYILRNRTGLDFVQESREEHTATLVYSGKLFTLECIVSDDKGSEPYDFKLFENNRGYFKTEDIINDFGNVLGVLSLYGAYAQLKDIMGSSKVGSIHEIDSVEYKIFSCLTDFGLRYDLVRYSDKCMPELMFSSFDYETIHNDFCSLQKKRKIN